MLEIDYFKFLQKHQSWIFNGKCTLRFIVLPRVIQVCFAIYLPVFLSDKDVWATFMSNKVTKKFMALHRVSIFCHKQIEMPGKNSIDVTSNHNY